MTLSLATRPFLRHVLRFASGVALGAFPFLGSAAPQPAQTPAHAIDLAGYRAESGIALAAADDGAALRVTWPISLQEQGQVVFNLTEGRPLVQSIGVSVNGADASPVARDVDPALTLTIGQRDAAKAANAFRGMVFFEKLHRQPHDTHAMTLRKKKPRASSEGSRTTVVVADATAGSFDGEFQFTFYRNSPLVWAEAVLSTRDELRAVLYDAGLAGAKPGWDAYVWLDPLGEPRRAGAESAREPVPVAARHRVIAAESGRGALAVFPAPHQYFYPLDFANNYRFAWYRGGGAERTDGFGLGIRQPLDGDRRFVPWIDAPAGSRQRLGMFCLVSSGSGREAIAAVARHTREDRFERLPGHLTLSSHYHVEHTADFLKRQRDQNTTGVPRGLETPGFVRKFKETGVDIVHLAEFHFGSTPGLKTEERLKQLKTMHEECARLSDSEFLLLPGEEPNVHLGGHWISLFPRPVYWVLNRAGDKPFMESIDDYGTVYHVGGAEDVLRLMQMEGGLMWTAHARIKSSRAFPDGYKDEAFFHSDRFLGAAWKAMPADLSRPRLGWRVLDLMDDMNQWGRRKQILGEVDVFRVETDYELYAHMNVNYLRMNRLPRYADGWAPVLTALREGQFFTTTGEILISDFTVAGKRSGETLRAEQTGTSSVEATLEWTFPLAFAEVISGDGLTVRRERVELVDEESFGRKTLKVPVELGAQKWVRFEVWDIAANGAFTQPVWLE